ncbi:hypothetical protein AVEN_253130-1 [Araneus ventricosus]|uniref:Uncharacterized protein n=1 Tax=Araneus ventricosus TaxID=182803 RepID=A0A4Y2HEG3_ARAVE|nr:hypothetical protein AVEN_253130-1 [Araneus ventricosus]
MDTNGHPNRFHVEGFRPKCNTHLQFLVVNLVSHLHTCHHLERSEFSGTADGAVNDSLDVWNENEQLRRVVD